MTALAPLATALAEELKIQQQQAGRAGGRARDRHE